MTSAFLLLLSLLSLPACLCLPTPVEHELGAAIKEAEGQPVHPAGPRALAFEKPWFCHDLDCPPFKVINSTKDYELRQYAKAMWVATTVEAPFFQLAVEQAFRRLSHYNSGENKNSTKIPYTAPLFSGVDSERKALKSANFTVGLYVPDAFQAAPPEPLDPAVFLVEIGECLTYVSQFGGWLVDDFTVSSRAEALRDALLADKVAFKEERFYTATYESPAGRLQNRHNEIMYSAEG